MPFDFIESTEAKSQIALNVIFELPFKILTIYILVETIVNKEPHLRYITQPFSLLHI